MSEHSGSKKTPKGGRKGGTQFPHIGLKEAVAYAKKLVSKTHTGAQPANVVLPGVFGSATNAGQIRASALKQYGLMIGESSAYEASKLAKDLDAAPDDEKTPYLREAFLNSKVFKSLHDIFVGDTVSPSRIRQQNAQLGIHPDNLEKAATFFIEGAIFAGLAQLIGDNILVTRPNSPQPNPPLVDNGSGADATEDQTNIPTEDTSPDDLDAVPNNTGPKRVSRAMANVSFNVDSSMDTDKLEKQLKLLRKYGVI